MLRVGTDCSGIEAPIQALIRLKIPFKHVFASDIDKDCIKSIKANYKPQILFGDPDGPYPDGDITKRDHTILPKIDLYVCGFPCQPFSVLGQRNGLQDRRGNVFKTCIEVIKTTQPTYFVLENVKGLLSSDDGKAWEQVQRSLLGLSKNYKYQIQWKVLNTRNYGIPQNRERLYIVGTKSQRGFEWPKETKMANINSFIDQSDRSKHEMDNTIRRFLTKTPPKAVFVDITRAGTQERFDETERLAVSSYLYSPCLITGGRMWCVPLKRPANIKELLSLQGFPKTFSQAVSNHQMKRQIGNSMSVNVLFAIFKNLLQKKG